MLFENFKNYYILRYVIYEFLKKVLGVPHSTSLVRVFCAQFYEDIVEPCHDCLYCGKNMTSSEECRRHLQSDCADRPKWDHSCLYCGLEFPTELGLIIHTGRWCKDKPKKI